MKQAFLVFLAILSFSAQVGPALAQFEIESFYREVTVKIQDQAPPYEGIDQFADNLEWGVFPAEMAVTWDDGMCHTDHLSTASFDGETITISGHLQGDLNRTEGGEQDYLRSRSLILLDFANPDPFLFHINYEKSGFHEESRIYLVDSNTGQEFFNPPTHQASGSSTLQCSGSGSYRLEIIHLVSAFLTDPGERNGTMEFDLLMAPVGTVATTQKTWAGVKSLFQ